MDKIIPILYFKSCLQILIHDMFIFIPILTVVRTQYSRETRNPISRQHSLGNSNVLLGNSA